MPNRPSDATVTLENGQSSDQPEPEGGNRGTKGALVVFRDDHAGIEDRKRSAKVVLDDMRTVTAVNSLTLERILLISQRLTRFSDAVLADRAAVSEALMHCRSTSEVANLQAKLVRTACTRYQAATEQLIDLVTQAMRDITDRACAANQLMEAHGDPCS